MERRPPLAAVVAIAGTIAGWISVFRVFRAGDSFGIDFGVFHSAGALIRAQGYEAAYTPESFSPYFIGNYYPNLADQRTVSHFISPPTFGWLVQPLSLAPYWLSFWVVLAIGFAVLIPVVKMLRLPLWIVPLLAVSPAMVQNVRLGQLGTFVLLLMVAVHLAASRRDPVRAGILAGLFILKPTLAIGYGLWWLIDLSRWHRAIIAAATTGIVFALPTFVGGTDPWRHFLSAMEFRVDTEGTWKQQSLSLPEFLKLLAPRSDGSTTLMFWTAGITLATAMLVAAKKRFGEDPELLSAVAVVATIVASPHLLVYDTFLLVIPIAVALHRGVLTSARVQTLVAIHVGSIVFGSGIYEWQFERFGRGIGLEFPGIVLCCWLLIKWWTSRERESSQKEDLLAVVANL